jgi:hypothetical protein
MRRSIDRIITTHAGSLSRPDALTAAWVGRENVIAGTDCGLGGRVHPEIAALACGRRGRRFHRNGRLWPLALARIRAWRRHTQHIAHHDRPSVHVALSKLLGHRADMWELRKLLIFEAQ